jgi:threonine/homoserine/homoserine lactone efflux protein
MEEVRLSRPRVLLRVALLLAGGLYMLWRAMQVWRASGELEAGAAQLQSRLALLAALIGALALLTALAAALSLRKRNRGGSLRLGPPEARSREP